MRWRAHASSPKNSCSSASAGAATRISRRCSRVATHEFEPTVFHRTLGSHDPVLRIASGDTVRTWTVDSSGYDRDGRDLTPGGNPQTGPFFVEGAEPGDTLAVHLDRLWPSRERGWTRPLVAPNTVDPEHA